MLCGDVEGCGFYSYLYSILKINNIKNNIKNKKTRKGDIQILEISVSS